MSYRENKILSLSGADINDKSDYELLSLFNLYLSDRIHGLCFSPYLDGQEPGSEISISQIDHRLNIIKPYTKWIRTFSCTDGNEKIPLFARTHGFKTLVGGWLGNDYDINEKEIVNLIKIGREGLADIVAVGNEVMYRGDLTEDELLGYIRRVKKELPGLPVGYVDAYYEFENRPRIADACDLILANCYPFWEGCSLEYSLLYMKDMYNRALKAGKGKKVVITETGWPFAGDRFHGSVPSLTNALRYFINTQNWSREEEIEIFYFSSFDESWKISSEGNVGAYWGLWDKDGKPKFKIS